MYSTRGFLSNSVKTFILKLKYKTLGYSTTLQLFILYEGILLIVHSVT
jgi:hypothetical protein